MTENNLKLKRDLVFQSFAPLFMLLFIKHFKKNYLDLVCEFFDALCSMGITAFYVALNHSYFGELVVFFISMCWLVVTILISLGFKGIMKAGFVSAGERIKIVDSPNDGGATFLVTYVLPLLTDDIKDVRGLIVFLTIIIMVILLLTKSNTFYQNPVLMAMGYRTFSFTFKNPAIDIPDSQKVYIGITGKNSIDDDSIVKRKYISDGVFVIYKE